MSIGDRRKGERNGRTGGKMDRMYVKKCMSDYRVKVRKIRINVRMDKRRNEAKKDGGSTR